MEIYNGQGYVKLKGSYGDVYTILGAARTSTGGEPKKGDKKDKGLLRYLYKQKHLSPFEMVNMTFELKVPLPIATQILRHRQGKFNQFSARYSEVIDECFTPTHWRFQGEKNHQGSGEELPLAQNLQLISLVEEYYQQANGIYNYLIDNGVAREQARFVIPTANFTVLVVQFDLRNFMHFLHLRLHEHAQAEIREVAQAMYDEAKTIPGLEWMWEIFEEFNELEYLFLQAKNKNTKTLKETLKMFIGD